MATTNPSFTQAAVAVVALAVTAVVLFRKKKEACATGSSATVSELNVYPIKSCAEISVDHATTTRRGFEGDRTVQVIDKDGVYCTPRDKDKEKLFHVQPEVLDDGKKLRLSAPGMDKPLEINISAAIQGRVVAAEAMDTPGVKLRDYGDAAAAWLEKATGIPGCRLTGIGDEFARAVKVNRDQGDAVCEKDAPVSLADEAPYLLTSTSSLKDLNRRLVERGKSPVDMRRFRPNIVVSGLQPWEEDSLKRIRIGPMEFHVWQRCGRCAMTTIDRDSLERGPEPLATLSTFRERVNGQRNFGMHLIPVAGQNNLDIEVGDEVEVVEYDEERRVEWQKKFS